MYIVSFCYWVERYSISFSDLVFTIPTSFDKSLTIAERDAESAADFIRDSNFYVDNMTGVDFLEFRGKIISIDNPSCRPLGVYYFKFRSNTYLHLVDVRLPDYVNLFESSLHLFHTLPYSSVTLPLASLV